MFQLERSLIIVLFMVLFIGMPVFAQQQISGLQSGTLGPGTYLVVGDISVQSGDSLIIVPGTTFLHNGNHKWLISGKFTAVGASEDSIYFIRQDAVPGHRWGALRFLNGAPVAVLDYCVVDHCYIEYSDTYPAGVNVYGGQGISLTHSRVSNCYSWGDHASGVYVYNGVVLIDSCRIDSNYVINHPRGPGIYLENCDNAEIKHSVIAYNNSDGM